jgi:hypothetical protein
MPSYVLSLADAHKLIDIQRAEIERLRSDLWHSNDALEQSNTHIRAGIERLHHVRDERIALYRELVETKQLLLAAIDRVEPN